MLTADNEIANVLATVPLFSDLEEPALGDLVQACTMLELRAGEVVFGEGDPAQEVFFVVGGRVRLTCETADGPDVVVGYVETGGILGEMGVIDPAPRSASARSAEAAVVLRLPGEALGAFIGEGHPVAAVLLREIRHNMSQRIHILDERIGALFLIDAGSSESVTMADRLRSIWSAMKVGG